MLLPLLLAIPCLVAMRMIRPFLLVRLGRLRSARLGHFTMDTELYLCHRELAPPAPRMLDVFFLEDQMCNRQLSLMWSRRLRIVPFAYYVDVLNRRLPGGAAHIIPPLRTRDDEHVLARTRRYLAFTEAEEREGEALLRQMGIAPNDPFVCFHARDPAYLEMARPDRVWRHHDYRDSSIDNYLPAMEALTRAGYHAFRMGAVVETPLDTGNPRIIDYANCHRTDFLDIYLPAAARFCVYSATGVSAVPMVFRRPVAWVNFIPLEHAVNWGDHDVFIPKKLWWRSEGRLMTMREMIATGAGRFLRSEQYEELGVDVLENTPEEITQLAIEVHQRLTGTWEARPEHEDLQRAFADLFVAGSEYWQGTVPRIGTHFLVAHPELLC